MKARRDDSYRATLRIYEGILTVGQLGSFRNESLGQVVYALSGGKSRKGMKADNTARDDLAWNMILLSTSEVSGRQKMEEESGRVYTGQLNRFIDIPVNEKEIAGVFNAELADQLKKNCAAYFGVAGIEFIESIIEYTKYKNTLIVNELNESANDYTFNKNDLIDKIVERHEASYQLLLEEASKFRSGDELSSELKRSIKRFALIFTAAKLIATGNIAALFDVDPNIESFDKDSKVYKDYEANFKNADIQLRTTLMKVFHAWLNNLNLAPRSIHDRIITSIRNYLFTNQAKFIDSANNKKIPSSIIGYYHKKKRLFLLTDETFAKACHGFSILESAKELDKANLLHKQDTRHKSYFYVYSINGQKNIRFYAIKDEILLESSPNKTPNLKRPETTSWYS